MAPDPEQLSDDRVRLPPTSRQEMPPELIEQVPVSFPSRRLWVAVALLLALVTAGWYADHHIRTSEIRSLSACDHRVRSSAHAYDVRMGAAFEYVRPSLGLLPPGHEVVLVRSVMSGPAKRVLPSVRGALAVCGRVHVMAWHSTIRSQRNADLAYAEALRRQLAGVADGSVQFQMNDPHLAHLRAAARIPTTLGA